MTDSQLYALKCLFEASKEAMEEMIEWVGEPPPYPDDWENGHGEIALLQQAIGSVKTAFKNELPSEKASTTI